MYRATGACPCGNIEVKVEFARPPENYRPRACDCDFCRKHSAAYVSDADGTLCVRIRNQRGQATCRQGSALAEFLFCNYCGVLACVIYPSEAGYYGAVNVGIIDPDIQFGEEQVVSPKALSPEEKSSRWREVWFSCVNITS
jgi:hypothetical protein